jgi:Tol biopolymer transport system component
MLTGERAFGGEDVSDTLANVLKTEPDWKALPGAVPDHIGEMMQWCLTKDRARRPPDASVARFLITVAVTASAEPALATRPQTRWRRAVPVAITATVIAASAALLAWSLWPSPAVPVMRFRIVLPEGQQFAGRSQVVAVSPDGSRVVYAAGTRQPSDEPLMRQRAGLYLRSLGDMDMHPIAGTNLDVMSPFFSPDGQWIGFYSFQDSTLKKIAVSGGTPVTLCPADPPFGVTWNGDGIVFADQGSRGILRVSPDGGAPEVLVAVKPNEVFSAPQMLDGGKTVLFTVATGQGIDRWDRAQIVTQTVGATERHVIMRGGSEGHYVPSGHLVYMVGATLFAVPVDRQTMQTRGGPVPLIEGVRRFRANIGSPTASFALSLNGWLVYISGSTTTAVAPRTLALATRNGNVQPLDLPPQPYFYPRVSPDGRQLAVQTDDGTDAIIWIFDLKGGGPPRRLTFGGRNAYPVWTPDGRRVTFQSDRDGDHSLFWQPADGTQPAERLSKPGPLVTQKPEAWSPDGKTLTLAAQPPFDDRLFTLSNDDAHSLKALSADLQAHHSAFSPDGHWLAYASTEMGNRHEVFVQPFPFTGAKYQISTEGGTTPLWSPDQTQLYYWANLGLISPRTSSPWTFGHSRHFAPGRESCCLSRPSSRLG